MESLTWTDFCQGFHWMYTAGASAWGWGEGRGRATESLTWTDFFQGILWVFTAGASFPDLLDERCPCTPLPFISSRDQQGGGGVIFHEQSSVRVCAGCTLPVLLLGGGEWGGLLDGQSSVRVSAVCALLVLLLWGGGGGQGVLTWTVFCQGFLWVYPSSDSFPDLLDERCKHTPFHL